MKKLLFSSMIALTVFATACNNDKNDNGRDDKKEVNGPRKDDNNGPSNDGGRETAASIAKRWCDLNGAASKAAYGPEQEKAEKALREFEDEMEKKYMKDEAFLKEIEKEVEKCEDASEKDSN